MIRIVRNIYLTPRFFLVFSIIIGVFAYAHLATAIFVIAQVLLVFALAIVIVDGIVLFNKNVKIDGRRSMPDALSLSDQNKIFLDLHNHSKLALDLEIIDELPAQFQSRDFSLKLMLEPEMPKRLSYEVRPLSRGVYEFGSIHLFIKSRLGLVQRKITHKAKHKVPVYPSYVQMKQFEIHAFARISHHSGIKKIRRLGHSYEFEQIKNYVRGDDYRSINWKATGRRMELMVNQYEDEKAQQIYSIVDKSRSMHMPFNGLSILDYAINTSLVISNIALLKQDKAGLVSFSDKMGTTIKADRSKGQLRKIMLALYNEKARNLDANYELLYAAMRQVVKGRSLIFLYTNFESFYAMERVLPILRKINRLHLLVVVIFENTEMVAYGQQSPKDTEGIYKQTMARKYVGEKRRIAEELNNHRIQTILTPPENLNVNAINKYLELKSKGMI